MIEKGQRLKPGDVLVNGWAADDNPEKTVMYLCREKFGRCKTFKCLASDNSVVHYCESDNRLTVVGHINEYDEFIKALKRLKNHSLNSN